MEKIEPGDTVILKQKIVLNVIRIEGDRALCSFQASEKPNLALAYQQQYEDYFPLSELTLLQKGQ